MEELIKLSPLISAASTIVMIIVFALKLNDVLTRLQTIVDRTVDRVQEMEIEIKEVKARCDVRHGEKHVQIRSE